MTQEEKAKAYDEALKRAKDALNDGTISNNTIAYLQDIFPELAESEDDGIRKEIISALKYANHKGVYDKHIAWLEKQGEKPQGKTAFEAAEEEKVDNANKVKPKFHEGEWIVWQDKCCKVNYNGCGYELVDQNGLSTSLEYGTADENAHLWDTTKDAKDGDVLVSDNIVFIFNKIHDIWIKCHCSLYEDNSFYGGDFDLMHIKYGKEVFPATKEQCDKLFKAMADAGYTFDFDKKELKKIEKPTAWSQEDDYNLQCMIAKVTSDIQKGNIGRNDELMDWLKSLRNRVQPQLKQEWSEEDEKIALSIEQVMNCASLLNLVPEKIEKVRAWLESLRPQKQWKPNKEQLNALDSTLQYSQVSHDSYEQLNSLYNDLKKLREENV